MERLTSKTEDGKGWVYTERHTESLFDDDMEYIGERPYFMQYKGKHVDKLAHYEDLEEMVQNECKKCKVDGHYAEWQNCDECGFILFKTE